MNININQYLNVKNLQILRRFLAYLSKIIKGIIFIYFFLDFKTLILLLDLRLDCFLRFISNIK